MSSRVKPCSWISEIHIEAHSPTVVNAQLWGPWELCEDDGTALGSKLMAVELIVFLSLNLTCD